MIPVLVLKSSPTQIQHLYTCVRPTLLGRFLSQSAPGPDGLVWGLVGISEEGPKRRLVGWISRGSNYRNDTKVFMDPGGTQSQLRDAERDWGGVASPVLERIFHSHPQGLCSEPEGCLL